MVGAMNSNVRRGITVLVALVSSVAGWGKVIYVDTDAPGANDGTIWENAYNFLQDALTDANSSEKPAEIRVGQGVYTPDSNSAVPSGTGDRAATFQLLNNVSLTGGYAGYGGAEPDARDVNEYETILSGDLDGNDVELGEAWLWWHQGREPSRIDNSYHVVTGSYTDSSAKLAGFTITSGVT
ncbi:MAG TPA: hypothetical protein VJJ98_05820 [Sedimentisphaerales bacterium]|nr:hypothetical protein [Sedimentisphaerales bacterium]